MATNKTKKSVAADVANPATEAVDVAPAKTTKKKDLNFPDHVMVGIQSNTYGELIYLNRRTGARITWATIGEEQPVPMGELRDMRNTQRGFFTNNRIFVTGVQDEEFADATPEDVYKALMVSQYYKDTVDPDDFNKIFTLSEDEIRTRLHRMGKGAQTNFIVAANEAIRSGRLDSLKKIRAIEECLGCELIQIQ